MEDQEIHYDRYGNTLVVGDTVWNEQLDPMFELRYWYEIIGLYKVYGISQATIRRSGTGEPHTVRADYLVWRHRPADVIKNTLE